VITAAVALVLITKYKHSYNRYFNYFLIYVLFIEVVALFPYYLFEIECFEWLKDSRFSRNFWFYNLFWVIGSACFFSFYFQKTLKIIPFKVILKYTRYIFLAIVVVLVIVDFDSFFKPGFYLLDSLNTAIVVGCVAFFFLELLLTDRILSFHYNLNFYIAVAILVWWLVTIPLGFYSEYYHTGDMTYVYLNGIILSCSNIFMYTCFTIGLLVSKPQLINE
jgi:disulfide bond formation protein DsbB